MSPVPFRGFAGGRTAGLRAVSVPLQDGDAGTAQTIDGIRAQIQLAFANPDVRAAAIAIARGVAPMNPMAQIQAVYQWVVEQIRFINDPPGHELVQTADFTLLHRAGDCDCITTLVLSLLGGMGLDGDLVTVATDPERPSEFSHIYPRAYLPNGQAIAVDAARELETGKPSFGAEPDMYYRKRIWDLAPGGGYRDLSATANPAPVQTPTNLSGLTPRSALFPRGVMAGLAGGSMALGSRIPVFHPPAGASRLADRRHLIRGLTCGLGQTDVSDILTEVPGAVVYDAGTNTSTTLDASGNAIQYTGLPSDGSPVFNSDTGALIAAASTSAPSGTTYTTSTGSTVNLPAALTAAGNAAAAALKAANSPYGAIAGYPGYQVTASGQIITPTGQVLSASAGTLSTTLSSLFSSPGTMLVVVALIIMLAEGKK